MADVIVGSSSSCSAGRGNADPTDIALVPTRYEYDPIDEDSIDHGLFTIAVEYQGRGLWGVFHRGRCLGADGEWDYEPSLSNREDEWLAGHRFPFEEAMRLAVEVAPKITVMGYTAAELLSNGAPAA